MYHQKIVNLTTTAVMCCTVQDKCLEKNNPIEAPSLKNTGLVHHIVSGLWDQPLFYFG